MLKKSAKEKEVVGAAEAQFSAENPERVSGEKSFTEKHRALALHARQLAGLLENSLEQNRLLLEERKSLWGKIQTFQAKRKLAIEKKLDLLAHLMALFAGDAEDKAVEDFCGLVGTALGLKALEQWRLRQAARLYRIGLFYVPEALRQKTALCFSGAAEGVFVQIPLASARLLEELDGMNGVAGILRQLGERCDGSGGPLGLKGRRILAESRILSAVLAYKALLEEGVGTADALRLLGEQSCWDPEVLVALRGQDVFSTDTCLSIRLCDLEPGMILTNPIHARAGAMLLPEGTCITAHHLERLLAYSRAGPLEDMAVIRKTDVILEKGKSGQES